MKRQIWIYAFDAVFRVVKAYYLEGESITIRNMRATADWMRTTIPLNVTVYAVDNRRGLCKEFNEAMKSCDFTKQIEFADMISKEGIQV